MKHLNKSFIFTLALIIGLVLSGCQRDDICPESTQTTSMLVIRFYDILERDNPQAPINLSIKEVGNENEYFKRQNLDSIAIPLRTDQDLTTYEFILNDPVNADEPGDQSIPTNKDIITFTYAQEQDYINRACSFKVNFIDLKVNLEEGEDGAWIGDYFIEQTEVENEANAHLSIYY